MVRGLRIGFFLLAGLLALGTGFPLFARGYSLVNHVPGIDAATVAIRAALFALCVALAAGVALVKQTR